eukprot:TRINITY_DN49560_c0_g1_i1.p1 TRINITY_DN49560_c0_g1~~TRINITY_DN49560_c0_g1_i1.p1  ORF type:complete len:171 (+),score=47.36 TRINITY_DN49560_c0_g1_i1:24-536(+)
MGSAINCTTAPPVELWEIDALGNKVASKELLEYVKRELEHSLWWSGGITFQAKRALLTDLGLKAIDAVAKILMKYPSVALQITSYTEEMPELEALKLSLERVGQVQAKLVQFGCKNFLVPNVKGFADNRGARIELTPVDIQQAKEFLALASAAELAMLKGGRACDGCGQQ